MGQPTAEHLIEMNRALIAEAKQVRTTSQVRRLARALQQAGGYPDAEHGDPWRHLVDAWAPASERRSEAEALSHSDHIRIARDRAERAARYALAAQDRAKLRHQDAADAKARAATRLAYRSTAACRRQRSS